MIEVGIFEADKSYFSLFLNLAEIVNLAKKIEGICHTLKFLNFRM